MDVFPILIGSTQTRRLGQVWVALSEQGLVAVEFGVSRSAFERTVRKQIHRAVEFAPHRVAKATRQIREYVDGKRRSFSLAIDWSVLSSDFQRAALRAVYSIPCGQTRTYAEVAAQIGHPDAPRAVGRANATNPMPLVIPCHRVIGSDGKLHGYGGKGGLETKAWLLKMEGAQNSR
jgi:methylated-DNA-[protein]-cysteine S-methyltransferase